MPRILLGGALIALVALVYALFDLSFTDRSRIRKLNRPLWFVIVVVLPIVGPLLWVTVGKTPRDRGASPAGDDNPRFGDSKPSLSTQETDRRIREIEEQLEALEAEEAAERARQESLQDDAAEPTADVADDADTEAEDDSEAGEDGAHRTDRGNGGQLGA